VDPVDRARPHSGPVRLLVDRKAAMRRTRTAKRAAR